MRIPLWLVLSAVMTAAACGSSTEKPPMTETIPADRDMHSYARPWEARVTHVALDLTADFAAKTLAGSAVLEVQRAAGAKEIVLDTKGLTIERVTGAGGAALKFVLGTADPTGTVDTWKRVVSKLPRGELHLIDGAGHLSWFDDGKEVAGLVRGFLSGAETTSPPDG